MSRRYWGHAMAQTDVGGLWAVAKIRPRWYWWLKRLWLFSRIVWRMPDSDPRCTRIDWRTAWEVARVAEGLGPCEVHRGQGPAGGVRGGGRMSRRYWSDT